MRVGVRVRVGVGVGVGGWKSYPLTLIHYTSSHTPPLSSLPLSSLPLPSPPSPSPSPPPQTRPAPSPRPSTTGRAARATIYLRFVVWEFTAATYCCVLLLRIAPFVPLLPASRRSAHTPRHKASAVSRHLLQYCLPMSTTRLSYTSLHIVTHRYTSFTPCTPIPSSHCAWCLTLASSLT